MPFTKTTAEIYVPDGQPEQAALARTTHLSVAAHQDDIEIMAMEGILACFGNPERWFTGVVVTDGAGSARDSLYARYTDEEMRAVRRVEQKKAAFVGEYSAAVFLDHSSAETKNPANGGPREDILQVLEASRPEMVYTHNIADKHPTHVAVAVRTIEALRELPREQRPRRVVGCEVWRDLDWMVDSDKVIFILDEHENIAAALVGVFDSQVVGGKRYDLATLGRRRAHATYHESHAVDAAQMINFGMDLTPLIEDDTRDIAGYALERIERFAADVRGAIEKAAGKG